MHLCSTYYRMNFLKKYKYFIILIIVLALGAIYLVFDPSASVFFPKCPFLSLTGLPCPGCGSQRAIHSLLNWDIASAVKFNFLLVALLPVTFIYIFSSIFRSKFPKFYITVHHPYVIMTIFVIVVLWWILRIVFGWYVL